MIICFCEDLWVINGVLTNKNIFDTNNVAYVLPGAGSKRQKRKPRNFMTKELLGIRIIK